MRNKLSAFGLILYGFAMLGFILSLSMSTYKMTPEILSKTIIDSKHLELLEPQLKAMLNREYESKREFISDFEAVISQSNEHFKSAQQWDNVIWTNYIFSLVKNSSSGVLINDFLGLFACLFLLAIAGALLYIFDSKLSRAPGIDNNKIHSNPMKNRGWLGILTGLGLIVFYIVLYWFPAYIANWVIMLDPLSKMLSGNEASEWFLYGFLYCMVMLVMGIRMILKYRHNKYQLIRTFSVIFFQISFAFLIPEILVRLNQPYFDFKNIWPLDYDFFFDWNINSLIASGGLGLFMLVWGIALFVIGVPILVYFYGKRWYCSWVCGCGGLAETLGDPYRQLSDKSTKAWKIERYSINGVLVFAVIMTGMTLYSFFSGQSEVLGLQTYDVQRTYGFLIGAAFSGVVGTGFYPLMGNRVWCRFGCPLAAYMGIIQRFKSRFRITTNGGQCISCGNCSTYCEMGIDVRWYAQRGQNIVRSSCVGCGICSAVCPRGVLNLENGPEENRINENPIIIGLKEAHLNVK